MDEELKAQFAKRFTKEIEGLMLDGETPTNVPKAVKEARTAEWIFHTIPKFIADIFEAGKEVGDLNGRLAGHALGVKEEKERIKKLELKQANLN